MLNRLHLYIHVSTLSIFCHYKETLKETCTCTMPLTEGQQILDGFTLLFILVSIIYGFSDGTVFFSYSISSKILQ